jgi:periplasmic protein thiol:disulfide oxidoreductases, DsbE subfamily
MNRLILISPLIILFVICLFVLIYLVSGKNPNKPPSALLNKDTPLFKSVSLYDDNSFINNESIKNKKVLINFFASWCTPCKVEHPLILELANNNPDLYILGFNHKDKKEDAKKYLKDDGDPYNFVGIDLDGLIALEFGVFGLPETFLINEDGKIIYKYMGPLTEKIIKDEIESLL